MSCVQYQNKLQLLFQFALIAGFIVYGVQNLWHYFQNDDLCEVSYKTFHSDIKHGYPSLSICFSSPFVKERLSEYLSSDMDNISENYESYLIGGRYSDQNNNINTKSFKSVPYEETTMQKNDFLTNADIADKNRAFLPISQDISINSWGWMLGIMKCFTFSVPYQKNRFISQMNVEFNNTIFPNNGTRPSDGWNPGGMHLFFHYPNQFATSFPTNKRFWHSRKTASSGPNRYRMRFYLKGMEVLRKRHKSDEICQDDMPYDDWIRYHIINEVGCRPPYWHQMATSMPFCDTKEKLKEVQSKFWSYFYGIKEAKAPCTEIKKLDLEYEEPEDDQIVSPGSSMISWYYRVNSYKEIKQMRAYTGMMLLGNVGGFLGLLLGYALIQIPSDLVHMFFKFKQCYAGKRKGDTRDKVSEIQKLIAPHDLDAGNTKTIIFESTKFAHKNDMLNCFSIKYEEMAQKNSGNLEKSVNKFLEMI